MPRENETPSPEQPAVTASPDLVKDSSHAPPPGKTDESNDATAIEAAQPIAPRKKKNRSGRKTTAQRGPTALPKNRGSGFEEYYADPPMTPDEAAEEKWDIYNENFTFEERIQSCIQRYRSRRRLQGRQTIYFNEYLFLGGIDTSSNAFGGQDSRDLKELTPAERRQALATDTVHSGSAANERFYTGNRENWTVDFAGVAAGFFSTALSVLTGLEKDAMETAIGLVENFLKYVIHHDVCPEYEGDIRQAILVCEVARNEWPMISRLREALPGQFNLAASMVFGQHEESDWFSAKLLESTDFDAKTAFFTGLALMDDERMFVKTSEPGVVVMHQFECVLQIKQIIRPSDAAIQRFQQMRLDEEHAKIPPVGRIVCKSATIEDEWDQPALPCPLKKAEEVTLYFDDAVLMHMKEGMKMNLTLCELNTGLRFVKRIQNVVPTFYTFLPQELMRHFKPPRPDNRPAPSIHDKDAGRD